MIAEQRLFICCLRDFCHDRKTDKPEAAIDEDYLFDIAEEQSLSGIVYYQCPWIKSQKFHDVFLSDVFLSVNRRDLMHEICDYLSKKNIPIICMKGAVYRDYYPVPELRSMGDIDFVIHSEDREVTDILMKSVIKCERQIDNHAVWSYWLRYFLFEIHDHMFYEYLANQIDYRGYFDTIWDHCHKASVFGLEFDSIHIPDDEFHFLYLITHTAKHIINKGMGFRPFLDMVFMFRNTHMNWDYLKIELEKLKLYDFTGVCFSLCKRWFDVDMPFYSDISEEFYHSTTEKMFHDGIFGLENEENEVAHTAKELKRSEDSYLAASMKLTFHKLFPPYRDMQLIPWYSWVDGKPYLMPVAWVYRWGYCLVHKKDHSEALLSEPFQKRKLIEDRKKLINEWRL